MLFIFVTCFSFLFFLRYSLPVKPLPPWASAVRLLSFYFWKDISILFPFAKLFLLNILPPPPPKHSKKHNNSSRTESMKMEGGISLLDLPNLALECILERLEADGLCRMACVCSYFRDICLNDHLWVGHMKKRWGRIIGPAAYKDWHLHISESNYSLNGGKGRSLLMGYLTKLCPNISTSDDDDDDDAKISSPPTVVSCYAALETGKFWFPAQVFNRENGHVGFTLSCYDAHLCYDSHTDSFQARYPPHGRRAAAIETGVSWDRIRAPPVDTSTHDLHVSDCLNNLSPKDHIEIQWRRNKQFPYGWWYGVVGHLEACDGNETYCHCHESDTVVLEFNQYKPGSRWRRTMISRRDHREEGNEGDGFYGGIRKLTRKDEILTWRQFWPAEILE